MMAPSDDVTQTIETLCNNPAAPKQQLVTHVSKIDKEAGARLRSLYLDEYDTCGWKDGENKPSVTRMRLIKDAEVDAAAVLKILREAFPDARFNSDEKGKMTRKRKVELSSGRTPPRGERVY